MVAKGFFYLPIGRPQQETGTTEQPRLLSTAY
jgi:hypothetical protein